jgi:hypothetical protein
MRAIGESFPLEAKEEFIESAISPGKVLYLFCTLSRETKNKFVVVVNPCEPFSYFLINSNIRLFIQKKPELTRCQILLKQEEHHFLTHDSYLDCTALLKTIPYEEAKEQISNDFSRISGDLNLRTRKDILRVVCSSKVFDPRDKDIILRNLEL